ncbi:MAG: DUF2817 domain-containing protein [Gammaproteobacteria bacterium]
MQLPFTTSEFSLAVFPDSYLQACRLWETHLATCGLSATVRSWPVPGHTPEGAALATHSAWLGTASARRVLVVIGGTHGIEGFAGTAVLCDLLARLPAQLPDDLAILCIHALNPWGYAWHRRCDAEGIDLNRNFIDFTQPLPDNPGYRALRAALFDDDRNRRQHALDRYRREHGQTAYEIAVSGGQYCDPLGPFYGGIQPAQGRRTIEAVMAEYRLLERRLAVIDVHTGLGPYGYGEIICDNQPDSDGAHTAHAWYGDECTLPALGTSSSVPKLGLLDYAWHAIMQPGSCFVTLEFGTQATGELFDVLLRDHRFRAAHGSEPTLHPDYLALVDALRAHFCPADPDWRRQVLSRARQVIDLALEGMLA